MIEAWGGILNLFLYALNMLGLGYYAYLTVFNPNTLVTRYDLGEKAVPIIRIVGSFVLPTVLLGVYVIFREEGPLGLTSSRSLRSESRAVTARMASRQLSRLRVASAPACTCSKTTIACS